MFYSGFHGALGIQNVNGIKGPKYTGNSARWWTWKSQTFSLLFCPQFIEEETKAWISYVPCMQLAELDFYMEYQIIEFCFKISF